MVTTRMRFSKKVRFTGLVSASPPHYITWHCCSTRDSMAVSTTLHHLTLLQHTRFYGRIHHTTSLDTAAAHEILRPCPPHCFTWHCCSTRDSTAVFTTLHHLTLLQHTRFYGRVHHTTSNTVTSPNYKNQDRSVRY